jgi:hypothetical protein
LLQRIGAVVIAFAVLALEVHTAAVDISRREASASITRDFKICDLFEEGVVDDIRDAHVDGLLTAIEWTGDDS